ncbi:MAG: hypothetical protein JNJ43_01715 [Anaerolineales bacterium]|nr:hypothetical protein [Anaerolineales bacterium]
MKIGHKILIWLVGVFLSCCFTMSLYGRGAGVTAIPHANVQLLTTTNRKTTDQIVKQVESLILSLGYVKQPNDGHVEWTYKKDDFTVSYNQEDDEEYRKMAVWVHFYQWNNIYFDESGLAEYQSFINALQSTGLELTWTNDPNHPGRKILTPEMFNAQHAPNPTLNRVESAMFGLALLLLYGVLILLPAFWIEMMVINRLSLSIAIKRILFVILNTLFLAPSPVPLPLLGPLPLVPAALMIPFVLASPEFLKLIGFSIIGMGIVSFFVSLLIKNSPSIDIQNSSSVNTYSE